MFIGKVSNINENTIIYSNTTEAIGWMKQPTRILPWINLFEKYFVCVWQQLVYYYDEPIDVPASEMVVNNMIRHDDSEVFCGKKPNRENYYR